MKYQIQVVTILLSVLIFFISVSVQAQTGRISGQVVDENSGDALPGANVYLGGTSLGTATDIYGNYNIINIPTGIYVLVARYLGFEDDSIEIRIEPNKRTQLDIKMKLKVIEGEEVLITAQSEGQMQAINQQLSSKTIVNVVSKKQIQELPEYNAAEVVGRLPGVSLERSGGEGNKVVIRGMASKYSIIQIDGVNMTATGEEDRSTDLSMISPYMLEGIELTKSIRANQEATATGGIVNFKIRKAPDIPAFDVIVQGGANSLRNTFKDYKLSIGGSNRFFEKQLGVYAQVDYEEKDAGSQQLGDVSFTQENLTAPVRTNSMQLKDIFRNVQRIGGALVLDYSLPSTTIKSSNFFSRINREETSYINNYDFTTNSFSINYDDTPERSLTILTNSLQIEHRWENWEINAAFSHSYSGNELPYKLSSENGGDIPDLPFGGDRTSNFNVNVSPENIPDSLKYTMDQMIHNMALSSLKVEQTETRERDLSGELSIAYTFNITDLVNVKLSLGGKLKHKTKEYDKTAFEFANEDFIKLAHDNFKISQRNEDYFAIDPRNLYLEDFLVKHDGDFLDDRYNFSPLFDKDKFRKLYELASAVPDNSVYTLYTLYQPDFSGSHYSDYHGTEDYHAFYVMPEINLGPDLLLVPGVRFEANRTEYTEETGWAFYGAL